MVQTAGQTIALPYGSFSKLELLATGVDGSQLGQLFTVHYTDGSSQTFTQNISDWHTPKKYAGETVVLSSTYRDTFHGWRDNFGPFDVYGYAFTLNGTKTVQSITLPNDGHVEVLAISMVALVAAPTSLTATSGGFERPGQPCLGQPCRQLNYRLQRLSRHDGRGRIDHADQQLTLGGHGDQLRRYDRFGGQHLLLRRQGD